MNDGNDDRQTAQEEWPSMDNVLAFDLENNSRKALTRLIFVAIFIIIIGISC